MSARRTFVVTGGSRNLGRACALELAAAGANVVVTAEHKLEEAENVARECAALGVESQAVRLDISDPADVESVAQALVAALGTIDGYVANAAIRPSGAMLDLAVEEWSRVIEVDLSSAFYLAKAFAPGMVAAGWGRIVHTSGLSAWQPHPGRAHVIAAKAGLHGFTKALAAELGPSGVTVNSVVPGNFDTTRTDPNLVPQLEARAQLAPVRRLGRPDEYGALCGFLMSERAGYITGQALHLSGGLYME